MIKRDHLEIVLALHQSGTLTRAAAALNLSQSALSHSMRRLEQQAGVALWEPDGRRIRLTQAGQYLRNVAERLVPQLADADRTLEGYAAGRRGSLRIGMECHPCYEWLLTLLPAFLEENPEIEVDVVQGHRFSGIEALKTHEIDLLITPDPLVIDGLEFEAVFPYELRLAVSTKLKLPDDHAHQNGYLSAVDFLDLDLLTYPVSRDRLDLFTELLIPAGVEPRSTRPVEATEVMLELVRAGRGVTALPDWMVARLGEEVQSFGIGPGGIHKRLALGFRAGALELPYMRAFLGLATQNGRAAATD